MLKTSCLGPSRTEATLSCNRMLKVSGVKIYLSGVMLLEFHEEIKRLLPKTIPGYSTDKLTLIYCGVRSDMMICSYDLSLYNLCIWITNIFIAAVMLPKS